MDDLVQDIYLGGDNHWKRLYGHLKTTKDKCILDDMAWTIEWEGKRNSQFCTSEVAVAAYFKRKRRLYKSYHQI